MITHPGLPITLTVCQEGNNVDTTELVKQIQVKTGQLITTLRNTKTPSYIVPITTISHLFLTIITNALKNSGNRSEV